MGPITAFFFTLQEIALYLNLVFLLISFVGGLYVAIHARNIPIWVRTPLWYLGVSSFIVAVSIILEFTVGPEFILSYSRFGVIGEMLINFNIAVTSLIMLVNTVWKDIRCMNMRKRND
jgi:hypothetical protein